MHQTVKVWFERLRKKEREQKIERVCVPVCVCVRERVSA
jgi:hypothetical protein